MPTNRNEFIYSARFAVLSFLLGTALTLHSQELVDATAHIVLPVLRGQSEQLKNSSLPAAIWLTPLHANLPAAATNDRSYTLLQKNKEFLPHLLIVPVGSVVHFPNADPFFHNVFSLFDGRRFDLGLYEAGTTRDVTFGREGVSYIFCNIHPEMSAVVIVLSTPYFASADTLGHFRIRGVPADDYILHVWVQGEDEAALTALTRKVRVTKDRADLGVITLPQLPHPMTSHENKFGSQYDTRESPVY